MLKLSAIVAVAFGLGLTFAQAFDLPRPGQAQPRVGFAAPRTATGVPRGTAALPSFSDIVDRVNPAVVFVQTRQRTQSGAHPTLPPEFQPFFRDFPQHPRIRQASGSGFIVSQDGYILTNNHVVEDADQVTVRLLDNREFTARVVGRDPNTDVAVIKIAAGGLPAVAFGN